MFDWESHARHREQHIKDHGQWIGLLDQDGVPLCDMAPIVEMNAPETNREPSSLEMEVKVRSRRGLVHPVVKHLVADRLGVDDEGALQPVMDSTRLVVVQRGVHPDTRRAYRVVSAQPRGGRDAPATMGIDGVDLLDMLDAIPCPSIPATWTGEWVETDRDWGAVWTESHRIQDIRMATIADGYTVAGPAEETIRNLIQRSLDTVFRAVGVSDNPPIVVDPTGSGLVSPPVILRPTDDSIWSTVAAPAAAAGVRIRAHLWLPGDTWGPAGLTSPTVVIRVEQVKEVSDG